MINTSPKYISEMKEQFKLPNKTKITFEIIDKELQNNTFFDATPQHELLGRQYFNLALKEKEVDYATCEKGGFVLGQGQLILPSNTWEIEYQGFVSDDLSNENGSFGILEGVPRLTIRSNDDSKRNVNGLTLTFDKILNRHPKWIKIEALFIDSDYTKTVIFEKNYEVDSSEFEINEHIDGWNELRIYILETQKPYQMARISHILFGLNMIFTNDNINSGGLKYFEEIDPITRNLSTKSVSFTFLDSKNVFDIDNPDGVWKYIKEKSKITVQYEQEISGGKPEIINGGIFYLDGMPESNKQNVTLRGKSKLENLDDIFYSYRSFWNSGLTFYDLASEIFEFAKLEEEEFYIDDVLKNFTKLRLPFPQMPIKDALKLVAEACMCILWEDRKGIIRIEPNHTKIEDFKLDFNDMWGKPINNPSPILKTIRGTKYIRVLETKDGNLVYSDILNTELPATNTSLILVFDGAVITEITGTADFDTYRIYDNFIVFNNGINRSGTLLLKGYKIITTETYTTFEYNKEGSDEFVENPLISDQAHLEQVMRWKAEHLTNRDTYYFNYKAFHNVEANDLFAIQTNYTETMPVRILRNEFNVTQSINGGIIAKRRSN